MNKLTLTGQKFGRLVAICSIKRDNSRRDKHIVWLCRCSCGNLVGIISSSLVRGDTKSCGCLRKERMASLNFKHGDGSNGKEARTYRIHTGIKRRCYNKNAPIYKRYGARGISMCDEWKNGYPAFKEWALANGYADNLTIDRIDNDGDYTASNCQWITRSENSKKKRKDGNK